MLPQQHCHCHCWLSPFPLLSSPSGELSQALFSLHNRAPVSKHQRLGEGWEKLPLLTVLPRHCLDEDTPVPDCPELPKERSIFIVWPFSGDYMAISRTKQHCKPGAVSNLGFLKLPSKAIRCQGIWLRIFRVQYSSVRSQLSKLYKCTDLLSHNRASRLLEGEARHHSLKVFASVTASRSSGVMETAWISSFPG